MIDDHGISSSKQLYCKPANKQYSDAVREGSMKAKFWFMMLKMQKYFMLIEKVISLSLIQLYNGIM